MPKIAYDLSEFKISPRPYTSYNTHLKHGAYLCALQDLPKNVSRIVKIVHSEEARKQCRNCVNTSRSTITLGYVLLLSTQCSKTTSKSNFAEVFEKIKIIIWRKTIIFSLLGSIIYFFDGRSPSRHNKSFFI